METNFSDYINDAVRILVLLYAAKDRKSIKITENKIKLYDYYLKFPSTMLSDNFQIAQRWDFDEYYAFFHWKPNLVRYRQSLNYLQAKELIEKVSEDALTIYRITDLGVEALTSINSPYKNRLIELANYFIPQIYRLSDKKIEKIILEKSKTCIKNGVVNHENPNKA